MSNNMSKKKATQKQEIAEVVQEEDTITIPVIDMFRQLKKYFLIWILIAVVCGGLVFGGSLALSSSHATPLTAMVGFTYDGIEKGLDPAGNEFDVNSMKAPTVVESALSDLDMKASLVDTVRGGLTISGVVPDDAIDELTAYQSIFEATNSIEAANKMMDVSYYPTQFTIEFSYADTGLSRSEAADLLNTLFNEYKIYFMQTFGYNDAFGDALTTVDYSGYDYPQAVDMFGTTLNTLQDYVSALSDGDTTRFRSTETGYNFSDLNEAISTMKSVDLASLSSYVYGKNVTKDKDTLATYYQYRIDTLTRSMTSSQEQLASVVDSIANYQKDSVVIMAGADNTTGTPLLEPSQAYDDLITQKTAIQTTVSNLQQQINDYKTRLDVLQKNPVGTAKEKEKTDADMTALGEKINAMVANVNTTADEYFETASYANSYSVLVPASGSISNVISIAISNMLRPILVVEALLFVFYLIFAVVRAFIVSFRRNALAAASAAAEEDDDEEEAEAVEIEAKKA